MPIQDSSLQDFSLHQDVERDDRQDTINMEVVIEEFLLATRNVPDASDRLVANDNSSEERRDEYVVNGVLYTIICGMLLVVSFVTWLVLR
jgi:hypothetical protein